MHRANFESVQFDPSIPRQLYDLDPDGVRANDPTDSLAPPDHTGYGVAVIRDGIDYFEATNIDALAAIETAALTTETGLSLYDHVVHMTTGPDARWDIADGKSDIELAADMPMYVLVTPTTESRGGDSISYMYDYATEAQRTRESRVPGNPSVAIMHHYGRYSNNEALPEPQIDQKETAIPGKLPATYTDYLLDALRVGDKPGQPADGELPRDDRHPALVTVNLGNLDEVTRHAIVRTASTLPNGETSPLGQYIEAFIATLPPAVRANPYNLRNVKDKLYASFEATMLVFMQTNLVPRQDREPRIAPAAIPAARGASVGTGPSAAALAAFAALMPRTQQAVEAGDEPTDEEMAAARNEDLMRHASLLSTLGLSGVRHERFPEFAEQNNMVRGRAHYDSPDQIAGMSRGEVRPIGPRKRIGAALMALVEFATSLVPIKHHDAAAVIDFTPTPAGHHGDDGDQKPVVKQETPPTLHTTAEYLWTAFKDKITADHGPVSPQDTTTVINQAIKDAVAHGYQVTVVDSITGAKVTIVDEATGKIIEQLGPGTHYSVTRIVTPDGKVITDDNIDAEFGALTDALRLAGHESLI